MFADRLSQFSRERLNGRELPEDLRIILTGHWEDDPEIVDLFPLEFLEPGEPNPLNDHSYLNDKERADPEMRAITAASDRMAEYVKLVAKGGVGWIGYWTHPDQSETDALVPIELDTEATLCSFDGSNLAEVFLAELAGYRDDPTQVYAEYAERAIACGLPISTRILDDGEATHYTHDPNELFDQFIEDEKVKRGPPAN